MDGCCLSILSPGAPTCQMQSFSVITDTITSQVDSKEAKFDDVFALSDENWDKTFALHIRSTDRKRRNLATSQTMTLWFMSWEWQPTAFSRQKIHYGRICLMISPQV